MNLWERNKAWHHYMLCDNAPLSMHRIWMEPEQKSKVLLLVLLVLFCIQQIFWEKNYN